jgi:hypothetical protein
LATSLLPALSAQPADVSGWVRDGSGALIPGASITLLNQQTGVRRAATSDERGHFLIPANRPGPYRISVRKSGFQTAARTGLQLRDGRHARVDFTLKLGPVEESVTVEGERPIRAFEDSATGTRLEHHLVENFPLNGRTILPLLEAAPGTVITPTGSGEVGQFSVNGQRPTANYFMVDGVSANFAVNDGLPGQAPSGSTPVLTALGSMHTVVSVESVDEVRMRTSTPSADYGRLPGAQLSLTTRAGTNEFHGSVFEYLRNEKLDANNWFSNSRGLTRAPLRTNDFGGSLGGRLRRDRTYFFAAFEALRMRQPFTLRAAVPTDAFREAAAPIVRDLLSAYPRANGAPLGFDQAEITTRVSRLSGLDTGSLRIDHSFGSKAQLFGRYYQSPSTAQGAGSSTFTQSQLDLSARGLTLGLTATLAPRWLLDSRLGWATARAAYSLDPIAGDSQRAFSRVLPPLTPASETNYQLLVFGLDPILQNTGNSHRQDQWNWVSSVTHLRGRHEFKAGVDARWILPSVASRPWNVYAVFADLDSVAKGQLTQLTISRQSALALRGTNLSLFAQDTWKLRPSLTLSYGVRWEWNPPFTGRHGQSLHPALGLDGDPARITLPTVSAPLWNPGVGNFAPRASFAWSPWRDRSFTVRGAAGLFYDLGYGAVMNSLTSTAPYFAARTRTDLSLYETIGQFPLPQPGFDPPYARGFAYEPGFRLPRVWHWNAGVEQTLGRHAALSANYVSLSGRQLLRREWLPRPNATVQGLEVYTNAAYSNYRALQVQLRSRTGSPVQYQLAYTLADSTDNTSRDSDLLPYGDAGARRADLGASSFDVRHAWHAALVFEPKKLRGWGLDWVQRSRSAFPVNVVTGLDPMQNGLSNFILRPNLVPGVPVWIDDPTSPGGRHLNRAAFRFPDGLSQGNLPRNALRGFDFWQTDLALRRDFRVREKLVLQFRVEAFNLFNRANLGDPSPVLNSATFGQSLQMLNTALGTGGPANGLTPIFQIGGPRSLQVSLRLRF